MFALLSATGTGAYELVLRNDHHDPRAWDIDYDAGGGLLYLPQYPVPSELADCLASLGVRPTAGWLPTTHDGRVCQAPVVPLDDEEGS